MYYRPISIRLFKPSDLIVGIDEVPDAGVWDILWKVNVYVTSIMRLFTMEDIISHPMHSCHNSLTWESCRTMISSHWYLFETIILIFFHTITLYLYMRIQCYYTV